MTKLAKGQVAANIGGTPIFDSIDAMYEYFYPKTPQLSALAKSTGKLSRETTGIFNAVYGQYVSAIMHTSDNAYSAIGAQNYTQEGQRLQVKHGKLGGIGTSPGGSVGTRVKPDYEVFRMPYKELPYPFEWDLALEMLTVGKDDTITLDDFFKQQAQSYANGIDYDLLKPVTMADQIVDGKITCVERLSRMIADPSEYVAPTEASEGPPVVEADPGVPYSALTPWGGAASDLYKYRKESGHPQYYGYVEKAIGALSFADLNKGRSKVQNYWNNQSSPENKMWLFSSELQHIVANLHAAHNMFWERTYTTKEIGGVKTWDGQDTGAILTNSYGGIPVIVDSNLNVDPSTQMVNSTGVGEGFLIDLDHVWMSILRPVEFRRTDQYEIYDTLTAKGILFMQGEYRMDRFACHAKFTGITG